MVRPILSRGTAVTITGFALIAVTYGLVRFSYGQFMPTIRAELDLTEGMAGVISSALFLGNCAALLIAAWATERFGGRTVATLSATMATVGLMGMAISHDPLIFAAWLMLAGSSAGFSMPPLVTSILVTVREERQAMATTIVNAGTGVGIMISGPIALYFTGLWRFSFAGFAALALVTTLATLLFLPKRGPVAEAANGPRPEPIWRVSAAYPILASAFLFGVVCACFWTFGGEILSNIGGWTSEGLSWFWILIGTAGLAGAGAGACVQVLGIRTTHTFSYLMVAAAIILLGLAGEHWAFPLIAGVLFGVLYILQTGLYLLWGLKAMPDRPATIVAAAFFMLPLGQVVGSVLMGYGLQWLGTKETLFGFVILCLMGALYVPSERSQSAIPQTA